MDPDVLLAEILELVGKLALLDRQDDLTPAETDGMDLAFKVRDLDGWLRRGGYMPRAWTPFSDHTVPELPARI